MKGGAADAAPERSPGHGFFWRLLAGFVVWSSAFLTLYAGHATGCELGWAPGPLRTLLLGLLALHFVALAAVEIARRRWRDRNGAVGEQAAPVLLYLSIAAFLSMLFCLVTVIWLPLC